MEGFQKWQWEIPAVMFAAVVMEKVLYGERLRAWAHGIALSVASSQYAPCRTALLA